MELTYDNHQGTDIRIVVLNYASWHRRKGAASGRVALVRRGLPDISFRAIGRMSLYGAASAML